jgi:ABC-type multidrug transport system fused ATPase/permease subunit
MQQGRIAAEGTHDELMADAAGLYHQLVRAQEL